ncbi:MBL fold metallo-hydrolase [Nonomuraea sp. NPDC004580]|uniref:MBL fold metallo-hydrolase n=1 Tax=Nonomuraea sp. NPDC004580 TaxID=3154552 RepID=UPI0033A30EDC
MDHELRYLHANAIIEPLVDRFYAWMHTFTPVQASMNLAFLQVPLLESYLESPPAHVAACANPELRGGYFVNVPESRADEVKALVAAIRSERAAMLDFAESIAQAEQLLEENATGFDLTPLYAKLPPALSGLVELVYDTYNQPSLRFLEPLIYHSPAFIEARQSVQLSLETGIERPFILSTPRLPNPGVVDLPLPFRHQGIDALFGARLRPTTPAALREALEISDDETAAGLARLLAPEPPGRPERHIESGGRVRYFGHACLVLQSPEAAIITDPFISGDSTASGRYTYDDLPDHIDLALITHGHQDHIVLESLLQLRGRIGTVVVPRSSGGNLSDPSLALYLRRLGMDVTEVDTFDEVAFPGGEVVAAPFLGEHASLDIRAKSTYWIRLAGRSVFVGADSSGVDPALYRHVRSHLGTADMAFLGMECDGAPLTWLYQALLTRPVPKRMSDSRKLSGSDAAQAADIVTELGTREAYIYAMGEESWLGHVMATSYNESSYQLQQIDEFLSWAKAHGVTAEHLLDQREWRW